MQLCASARQPDEGEIDESLLSAGFWLRHSGLPRENPPYYGKVGKVPEYFPLILTDSEGILLVNHLVPLSFGQWGKLVGYLGQNRFNGCLVRLRARDHLGQR